MGGDVSWSGVQPDTGLQAECRDFLLRCAQHFGLEHEVYDGALRANLVKNRVGYVNADEFCGVAFYPGGRTGLLGYSWAEGGVASVVFDRSDGGALVTLKPLAKPSDQDRWFEPYLGGCVDPSLPTYLRVRGCTSRERGVGLLGDILRAVMACYVPELEVADDTCYFEDLFERVAAGREPMMPAGLLPLLPEATRSRIGRAGG